MVKETANFKVVLEAEGMLNIAKDADKRIAA